MEIKTEVPDLETKQISKKKKPKLFKYTPEHVAEICKYCPENSSLSWSKGKNFWGKFTQHFNQKFNCQQSSSALQSKFFNLMRNDPKHPGSSVVDRRKGGKSPRKHGTSTEDPKLMTIVKDLLKDNPDDSFRTLAFKLNRDQKIKVSQNSLIIIAKNLGIKRKPACNVSRDAKGRFLPLILENLEK